MTTDKNPNKRVTRILPLAHILNYSGFFFATKILNKTVDEDSRRVIFRIFLTYSSYVFFQVAKTREARICYKITRTKTQTRTERIVLLVFRHKVMAKTKTLSKK